MSFLAQNCQLPPPQLHVSPPTMNHKMAELIIALTIITPLHNQIKGIVNIQSSLTSTLNVPYKPP